MLGEVQLVVSYSLLDVPDTLRFQEEEDEEEAEEKKQEEQHVYCPEPGQSPGIMKGCTCRVPGPTKLKILGALNLDIHPSKFLS